MNRRADLQRQSATPTWQLFNQRDRVTVMRCGSMASSRAGSNAERSTALVVTSMISSATASPVAGALRIPQTPCPVARYAPATPAIAPISGSPSSVTGRKHAWLARTREDASIGEIRAQSAFNRSIAPSSDTTRPGSVGRGELLEVAHTYVVPSTRGKTSGENQLHNCRCYVSGSPASREWRIDLMTRLQGRLS